MLEALKVLIICLIMLLIASGAGIVLSVVVSVFLVGLPIWGAFQALAGKS
jgi:hypothetical protein